MDTTKTVFLHGFDRSGSSAISKLLSTSPDIELFMQIFNGGPFRNRMYEIWDNNVATEEDKSFISGLENAYLDVNYIVSPWFKENSTTHQYVKDKLHIVKTTISHFSAPWIMESYNEIDHWAIWRNPMNILQSLLRNDFVTEWYKNAVQEITPAVKTTDVLRKFEKYIEEADSPAKEGALLIAVRTEYLFSFLDPKKIISYEEFTKDPQKTLGRFTSYYNVKQGDYDDAREDLNLIGEKYTADEHKDFKLSTNDLNFVKNVFNLIEYTKR